MRSSNNSLPLILAWLVSAIATATSLYWSNVIGWIPCDLCWFERIFMYPAFVLLTMALWYRDRDIYRYVLPLSILGAFIALYHYLYQIAPGWFPAYSCTSVVSCQYPEFDWFGWITPPLFAFAGFVTIATLMWRQRHVARRQRMWL